MLVDEKCHDRLTLPPLPSPQHDLSSADAELLARFARDRRIVVVTGAGCSTESGIPDYRGHGRPPVARQPIQHQAFVSDPNVQRRYWARATLGWPRFASARPNAAHHALALLEAEQHVIGIITQNVDRLHRRAGSRRVVELHGALADVVCMGCQTRVPRDTVQARLLSRNPNWLEQHSELSADGDAHLPDEAVAAFRPVDCLACGGSLRPDVVFFGGSVAKDVVAAAWQLVAEADAMLVVGSSLTVFSGYRFVRGALDRGMPVAVVNQGTTRVDGSLLTVRVHERAGDVLPRLAASLTGASA